MIRSSRLVLIGLFAAVVLLSCDIPTESPSWDTRWIVPADETVIEVSEFLPDGMTVTPDGNAFDVAVDPFSFSRSLGEACPSCLQWDGQIKTKPEFITRFAGSSDLPTDVLSIEVDRALVQVGITNGFNFDPIRPSSGSQGSMVIRLFSSAVGDSLLAESVVDGAIQSFPPHTTINRSFQVEMRTITNLLRAEIVLDSPAGDSVLIDCSSQITVVVQPDTILISSALIDAAGKELVADPVELDVEDVEDDIVDHIQSGAFDLFVQNPFAVAMTFDLRIMGPFDDIRKQVMFSEALACTSRVVFTQEELRTFLGQSDVMFAGTGTVSSATGMTTVTPWDTLRVDTRLDAVIQIGD